MKKILVVFGTRPEAIKLLPLVSELKKYKNRLITYVCVTAQHRAMLDQVLELFKIKPDLDLNIMTKNQSLTSLTHKILNQLEEIFKKIEPDYLIIQGDTTTTFVASLIAFYHRVKILHVEAGLRTDNKYKPFPEEINRRLTSVLCDYHFVPTEKAKANLLREGYLEDKIIITGNTGIDALFYIIKNFNSDAHKIKGLEDLDWDKKLVLVTGHRRENFGIGFENICNALKHIAEKQPVVNIVYSVHLNPNVREIVFEKLRNVERVFLIDPLPYNQFVFLMNKSFLILTDSGGIQEEAPALGKPVLVMRDTTERPEIILENAGKLVGTETNQIVTEVNKVLDNMNIYNEMAIPRDIYGDGKAAKRICNYVIENLLD